jgi:hypothetical protein
MSSAGSFYVVLRLNGRALAVEEMEDLAFAFVCGYKPFVV